MVTPLNVLAIAGSLRAESVNASLVRAIAALTLEGTRVVIYQGLGRLPLFSPDLDGETPPPEVTNLWSRLRAADAVLICTPEYAYGMPGSLKNALDWLVSSGELYRKPVAALSAAPSDMGGARALAWLRETLAAQGATVPEEASFAVPFIRQHLHGDALADDALASKLRGALAALKRAVSA